jgi:hypothetical protein
MYEIDARDARIGGRPVSLPVYVDGLGRMPEEELGDRLTIGFTW